MSGVLIVINKITLKKDCKQCIPRNNVFCKHNPNKVAKADIGLMNLDQQGTVKVPFS